MFMIIVVGGLALVGIGYLTRDGLAKIGYRLSYSEAPESRFRYKVELLPIHSPIQAYENL